MKKALVLIILLSTMPLTAMAKAGANGKATVYSDRYQGKRTASGQHYNKGALTAASATLPLGSKVLVKNKCNGRSVKVVINDRKAAGGAKLDLSKTAANQIGIKSTGQISCQAVK